MSDSAQRGAPDQRNVTTRAAETDRIQVAQLLTDAAAQGRLQMSDYEDRLTKAYAAKTYDELDQLRSDLIGSSVNSQRGGATKPAPSMLLLAIMSAFERRGRWKKHPPLNQGRADHPAAARSQRRDQGPRCDGRVRPRRRRRRYARCAD